MKIMTTKINFSYRNNVLSSNINELNFINSSIKKELLKCIFAT